MKHNLYQKDILLNKRWFEITQEGLSIKSKSIRESNELSLRFEDIGLKVVKSKNGKTGWLIATLVSLGLSAIILIDRKTGGDTDKGDFLFYFLLSLVFFVIFVLTYKRSFYLTNNENKNAI